MADDSGRPPLTQATALWATYDSEAVLKMLDDTAGAWACREPEGIITDLYRARRSGTRPAAGQLSGDLQLSADRISVQRPAKPSMVKPMIPGQSPTTSARREAMLRI
jgi:hypothetical protein